MNHNLAADVGRYLCLWRSHMRMDVGYPFNMVEVLGEGELTPKQRSFAFRVLARAGVLRMEYEGDPEQDVARFRATARWWMLPVQTDHRWQGGADRSRPAVSKACRDLVVGRDFGRCRYCGDESPGGPLDHVVPHTAGGPTDAANLVLSCSRCNSAKGARLWVPRPAHYAA